MPNNPGKVIVIYDDREFVSDEINSIVGRRKYGDVLFKRKFLFEYFMEAIPEWLNGSFFHIRDDYDVALLKETIESRDERCSICIFAAQGGYTDINRLKQLIERLPYAEESFVDLLYKPLLNYIQNAHWLVEHWKSFEAGPVHKWERAWQNSQRLSSVQPLNLANVRDFLLFTTGSTATRHFNEISGDTYYYTKSSSDKKKMLAEFSFYGLVPERMKPWLVQTFDYEESESKASYSMLRYYLADSALQWVHGAFDVETFEAFVDRLLFFIKDRPQKKCSASESSGIAQQLFVDKVKSRIEQFLELEQGKKINNLASSGIEGLEINALLQRYLKLFDKYKPLFEQSYLVVGHGDPCFSNILYDQQKYILKLIDPKGAIVEADLWTHSLYDVCKISHSVLGDYDFINNGLYSLGFDDNNQFVLSIKNKNHQALKSIFRKKIQDMGLSTVAMRLGEASLFLSMLPLHIDYPNKVMTFMLIAKSIIDEIENER
jgi:hypothetical protein